MLRAGLTLFLATLLASLFAIDPILCPDGCGDEPIDTASAPADADCSTCRGSSAAATALSFGSAGLLVRLGTEPDVRRIAPDPNPIEHPPRPR